MSLLHTLIAALTQHTKLVKPYCCPLHTVIHHNTPCSCIIADMMLTHLGCLFDQVHLHIRVTAKPDVAPATIPRGVPFYIHVTIENPNAYPLSVFVAWDAASIPLSPAELALAQAPGGLTLAAPVASNMGTYRYAVFADIERTFGAPTHSGGLYEVR